MDNEKLLDRLRKLHALTDKPEGREEEARTAAWLLIKTAREHGVTLRFLVQRKAPEPTPASRQPQPPKRAGEGVKWGPPTYQTHYDPGVPPQGYYAGQVPRDPFNAVFGECPKCRAQTFLGMCPKCEPPGNVGGTYSASTDNSVDAATPGPSQRSKCPRCSALMTTQGLGGVCCTLCGFGSVAEQRARATGTYRAPPDTKFANPFDELREAFERMNIDEAIWRAGVPRRKR